MSVPVNELLPLDGGGWPEGPGLPFVALAKPGLPFVALAKPGLPFVALAKQGEGVAQRRDLAADAG